MHDTADDDDTDADAVDAAAHDLELIGYVGLADTARPSSRPLIEALLDAELAQITKRLLDNPPSP